jgi:MerR family copper efflux transcriptional regulator
MVKGLIMLISEFARAAELSVDTVRFYVRKGLLQPATGRRGGANPYQIFAPEHVEQARIIRMAQGLGFSLREIAALAAEYNAGGMTPARSVEVMRSQLARLEEKADQLNAMVSYVRAKIAWLEGGECGPEPGFGEFECPAPIATQKARTGLKTARG